MVDPISSRQHQILKLLLENKEGLSIDEIANALGITRNAVQQHFTSLERDGYIEKGELNKTAGRPVRSFVLTESGINRFPKQYSWLSDLVFSDLKEEMGSEAFQNYLHKLGVSLSNSLIARFEGKSIDERIAELLKIMNELGFQTKMTEPSAPRSPCIEACNCIYHDIAQKHQEICEFDRTLISSLLGREIDHVDCMAKGASLCRFKIKM